MRRLLLVLVAFLLVLAGCIRPDGTNPADDDTRTANSGGVMTVDGKEDRVESPCPVDSGGSLPSVSLPGGTFCARRTVSVSGTLSGIGKMDVILASFNGDVAVRAQPGNAWSFKVVMEARGETQEAAKANLDAIEFSWSHEAEGSHDLVVQAKRSEARHQERATMDVVLPESLVMVLAASTSNGDVTLRGARTDGLALSTSNGDVTVEAAVTQTRLSTSNGAIEAKLTPTASGRASLSTSNGRVTLTVPEDGSRGYQVDASTSNGKVVFELKDGRASECPASEQRCTARTFETERYAARAIQQEIEIGTSNGDVTVRPG